jgi:hypothetical protein
MPYHIGVKLMTVETVTLTEAGVTEFIEAEIRWKQ